MTLPSHGASPDHHHEQPRPGAHHERVSAFDKEMISEEEGGGLQTEGKRWMLEKDGVVR